MNEKDLEKTREISGTNGDQNIIDLLINYKETPELDPTPIPEPTLEPENYISFSDKDKKNLNELNNDSMPKFTLEPEPTQMPENYYVGLGTEIRNEMENRQPQTLKIPDDDVDEMRKQASEIEAEEARIKAVEMYDKEQADAFDINPQASEIDINNENSRNVNNDNEAQITQEKAKVKKYGTIKRIGNSGFLKGFMLTLLAGFAAGSIFTIIYIALSLGDYTFTI